MNKSAYYLSALVLALCFYLNFPFSPTSATDEKQDQKRYAQVGLAYKDSLVGTYKIVNADTQKDLILDSTYTYSYLVQEGDQTIVLEGSWELSYKNQAQHIILHRPTSPKNIAHIDWANFEERKFRVTQDGLTDPVYNESYLQIETNEYSLAIYQK